MPSFSATWVKIDPETGMASNEAACIGFDERCIEADSAEEAKDLAEDFAIQAGVSLERYAVAIEALKG